MLTGSSSSRTQFQQPEMLSLGLTTPRANFGATQGHDGDTVTLWLSFDGSMGLFRRPVASRKKMRIKGGVTTEHLRRDASTRYTYSPQLCFVVSLRS
jgi:hypothetical protein